MIERIIPLILLSLIILPFTSWADMALLPRTGQTTCYDASGNVIDCAGTGQDGELLTGVEWPNPRFTDNGNGTVTDNLTGLEWTKDANLMRSRDPSFDNDLSIPPYSDSTAGDGKVNWQHALAYVLKLNNESYLGYNDWRLPNIIELDSIVNLGQADPSGWLNSQGFINVKSSVYRASTSAAVYPDSKCLIAMGMQEEINTGYNTGNLESNYSVVPYYVWPVRSGQSSGTIALPVTGQTVSYAANDDGALQKGQTWPNPRFTDNADQTITDNLTNLIWTKDANAPGPAACGPSITKNWQGALDYVKCLNSNSWLGISDWRLPNRKDLLSLANAGQVNSASWLNSQGFSNTQITYWSSTTSVYSTSKAFSVDFGPGFSYQYDKSNYYSVRPVRGGGWLLDRLTITGSPNFDTQNIDTTPESHEFNLSNSSSNISISSISITGTNAADFHVAPGGSHPCSSLSPALNAGGSCTVLVTFTPNDLGARSANLTVSANSKSVDIPLTGTGVSTIMGTVTDLSTGNRLAGVSVAITGGATTTTNSSGRFIFTPSPAYSTFTVNFAKTGYGTLTKTGVTTSSTAGATLNVGLTPSGALGIIPDTLPPAETGEAYPGRIRITGGTGPFVFTKPSGTLPPGLEIDPGLGNFTGAPTTVGTYSFAIRVTDSTGTPAQRSFSITVTQPLTITTASPLPRGITGVSYSRNIVASGGDDPYSFAATGLPSNGLSMSSGGVITGTPSAAAPVSFTVTVNDNGGRTVSKGFTIGIDDPLSITTTTLNAGSVGTAYNQTLVAAGGLSPRTWSITSGSLPPGLTLSSAGVITGAPLAPGGALATITVRDSYGRTASRAFTLTIPKPGTTVPTAPLAILTTTLPNVWVGNLYSETVRVSGGKAPLHFTKSGIWPAGLDLDPNTGVIHGTASSEELTNISVTVTDSSTPTPLTQSRSFTIQVTSSFITITTPALLPPATKGSAVTPTTLAAAGGTAPYNWAVVGGYLPQGLNLNPTTGVISGTPLDHGDFSATIRVTDSVGGHTGDSPDNPDKPFFITVYAPPAITTDTLPHGGAGVPYLASLSSMGGLAPYTWAVKSGSPALPPGLSPLNPATGAITGTPTTAGSTLVTFEVTDNAGRKGEKILNIAVSNVLDIVETSLPKARVNQPYSALVRTELGKQPFSWNWSGNLPPGITPTDHGPYVTLDGTPTTAGTYTFTLEADDTGSPVQHASREFTIIVAANLQITTAGLKAAVPDTAYSSTVAAAGGIPPYRYSIVSGAIPQLLTFNTTTGAFSGRVNLPVGQSTTFTVRVTDSGSPAVTADKPFTITTINPLVINTATLPPAVQKSAYSTTFTGSGGLGALSWSIASGGGNIQGLTMSSGGVLSGSPVACGSLPFSVRVSDSAPSPTTYTKDFTLNVTCSNDYVISGSTGVSGATVTLSGAASRTTTSGAGGSYSFGPLTNGVYTVTPSKAGYSFNPASRNVTVSNMDLNSVSFAAIDMVHPQIDSFTLPATSETKEVPVTLTASDNVAVTGYYLSELSTAPAAGAAGWKAILPLTFTFSARGPRNLYAWVKDAAGNLSTRADASVIIEYELSVTLNGTGHGTVNSDLPGIGCDSGTCKGTYAPDTSVTLTETADGLSTFTAWSGACTPDGIHCGVSMTADRSITATFTAAPKAKIGSTGYGSLNAAYTAASTTDETTIRTLDTDLNESLTIGNGKRIKLVGAYNATYSGRTGIMTGIKGITIGNGSLTVDGVAIK